MARPLRWERSVNATSSQANLTMNTPRLELAILTTRRPSADEVVSSHRRLVERVAYRLRRRLPVHVASVEVADLIAAGYVGLLDAYNRFDWTAPDQFATYAEFRIKGAMLDELRGLDPAPRAARRAYRNVERTRERLTRELGRRAGDQDVAAKLGLTAREVGDVLVAVGPAVFDDIDGYSEVLPLTGADPHDIVERRATSEAVRAAIAALPDRQRDLLTAFHLHGESLTAIAGRMGVTVGRASQIKSAALRTLRASLSDHGSAFSEAA